MNDSNFRPGSFDEELITAKVTECFTLLTLSKQ